MHELLTHIQPVAEQVLRLTFDNSDVLLLRNLSPIDPSIYGVCGKWTAEVVSVIRASEQSRRYFKAGSGIDFDEANVVEISKDGHKVPIYTRPY